MGGQGVVVRGEAVSSKWDRGRGGGLRSSVAAGVGTVDGRGEGKALAETQRRRVVLGRGFL